ncbi:SLC13 family permease [Chloroflexota bacterium]
MSEEIRNSPLLNTKARFTIRGTLTWFAGGGEYRPVFILIAFVVFFLIINMPTPASLEKLLTEPNPVGYATEPGNTIVDHLSEEFHNPNLTVEDAAHKVKITLGMLAVAAILWGTVAIPLGATGFLLAAIMYIFHLMPIDMIAKSYMKDAVFFIIGALSVAVGVEKTGLHHRIGLIFLGWTKGLRSLLFFYGPLMAVVAMFISAKCLIAFLMPVLMRLYKNVCKANGLVRHPPLGLFLILVIVYMTAMGGPGAPTVGARNAIMVDFFATMGKPMTFIQWMQYGFLFVPVGSIAVGIYLYLLFNKKLNIKINPGERIREEVRALGPYKGHQVTMTVILFAVIFMWVFLDQYLRLGGPILIGTVLMFLTGVVSFDDLNKNVSWSVIWMYAAAVSMGYVLYITGTALWLATTAFDVLPPFMKMGEGLLMSISVLTTVVTNFMSDGAAVAVIGPITLPMHTMAGLDLWQVGLATAFSSSFAHVLIIGRPGLAIAYAMGVDPDTRERLLHVGDLIKYGLGLVLISWVLLWGWTFYGYWRFMTF